MILCSGTLGQIPFRAKAEAAAAAGFGAISIYSREHDSDTRRILDGCGLAAAELDGPMAWMPGQAGIEAAQAIDIAADVGARSVTVLELTGQLPPLAAAAAAFGELCDLAAPLGLVVHIEPFAWSGIAALADAAAIVEAAGRSNGGILLDTWHLLRGPDAGAIDSAAARSVVAIQISDPSPTPLPSLREDCLTNREWPGDASIAIVRELRAMGCDAPLEVERFTDGASPTTACSTAADAYRRVLSAITA